MTASVSEILSQTQSAIEQRRAEVREINQELEGLEMERLAVGKRPPHTDDIVALYRRGLDEERKAFERELKTGLGALFVSADDAAQASSAPQRRDILRFEGKLEEREVHDRALRREGPSLNISALSYFLADIIGQELPGLIERHCPAAANGIKAADRAEQLAQLDREIATLTKRRDELLGELTALRQAASI